MRACRLFMSRQRSCTAAKVGLDNLTEGLAHRLGLKESCKYTNPNPSLAEIFTAGPADAKTDLGANIVLVRTG